jgi:predicted small metal-binding protein
VTQFRCGLNLVSDHCDWYAQEMLSSDLRIRIIEHAKTAHNMDPIPITTMTRIDRKLNRKSMFRKF